MNKKIKMGDIKLLFEKYGNLNLRVKTPYGYKKIIDCQITENNSEIQRIKTKNNLFLDCSKNHRIKIKNGKFCSVKNIVPGQIVLTEFGHDEIVSVESTGIKKDLIDIEVDEVQQYYSNGILSHNSTMTVDLMLYLFFNSTTKGKTALEVFNTFRDCDEVKVKGYIIIDGIDYIIERKIIRKKSKSGEFSAKSELEFYKIDDNGNPINLAGEQRRETEKFITSAIGTEEDFLATILTTGGNLEDLIDSKPTARGQVLTRFLGLEALKKKEEVCKEIYNEWSKKLVSNTYNIVQLESDNELHKIGITDSETQIVKLGNDLANFESELKTLNDKRDELMQSKNNDIDQELIRTNPVSLKKEIDDARVKQNTTREQGKLITVTEPSKYYSEDEHTKISKDVTTAVISNAAVLNDIGVKTRLVKDLETGKICPTCKRALDDTDHTEEINSIKKEIETLVAKTGESKKAIDELQVKESGFVVIKKEYEEYERNKLRKAKNELEVEQIQMTIDKSQARLDNYDKNKSKLEQNQKIDGDLVILKTKIETSNADIRLTNTNIEKNKANIITLDEKIKINIDLIKKIKSEEELIAVFKTYLMIYGKNGISKVIMKNMIPLLNQELHRVLADSCNFSLELNINDKNELEFLMIDNETRIVKSLNSGSGYEKTIASLALRSVLTKVSSLPKPNIVVMDEVFKGVADENLELMGEFFKKIKNYFEHIFVISHNPLIRNWSDNLIMVKKEENVSSIESIIMKMS